MWAPHDQRDPMRAVTESEQEMSRVNSMFDISKANLGVLRAQCAVPA